MSTDDVITLKPTKVDQKTFLGVIWGGVAIAIICVSLRTVSRIRMFRRLYVDDGFVVFALILVTANAILWQEHAQEMFDLMAVSAGIKAPGTDFVSRSEAYSKASVAVISFFYSTLWSVKVSFLIFFRRLGENISRQKYIWWPVFAFTLAAYFACIGTIQYDCLVVPLEEIEEKCVLDPAVHFQEVTLKLNCAWDVLTDFAIMSIPISLLWEIQMKIKKKLLLGLIFSLAIITVIVSIVRTTVVSSLTRMPDTSWLYMWSAIEATVAIIVVCLASIRNLFTASESQRKSARYVPPTLNAMHGYVGSSHRGFLGKNSFSHGVYIRTGSSRSQESQNNLTLGGGQPLPLERVYINHNIEVSHETV